MIGEVIECQFEGCEVQFTKKTHNQIYHDEECCRLATNASIMKKYYKKRAQRLGLPRFCVSCNSRLSRYNSDDTCGPCQEKSEVEKSNSVRSMLTSIQWAV